MKKRTISAYLSVRDKKAENKLWADDIYRGKNG